MAGGTFGCILILVLSISFNDGQRLRDNMYESLYAASSCFRRLNGTHQIGCSSSRGGSVGVVQPVEGEAQLAWVLEKGRAPPYAVVLDLSLMTPAVLERLAARPDRVAGIIITQNSTDRPAAFSHEERCPNSVSLARGEGVQECVAAAGREQGIWNPLGSGLMRRDFPFPIFLLPHHKMDSITSLQQCYLKFNSFDQENQPERSLCAVDMDTFMFAAVDSRVCMRRSKMAYRNMSPVSVCQPLSDQSVFFSHSPRVSTEKKGSLLLVTATMDATSFFEGEGLGAVSAVAGLVVMLGAAQLLRAMIPNTTETPYDNNVLFYGLNGEAYDMIGSQRLAWDLSHGTWPPEGAGPSLALPTLSAHIHLGQLQLGALTAFTPDYPQPQRNQQVEQLVSWLEESPGGVNVTISRGRVPPSPLHSFLRILNSTAPPSLHLAAHGPTPSLPLDPHHQSLLDDGTNLHFTYLNLTGGSEPSPAPPGGQVPAGSVQRRLADVATALGGLLYRHMTGTPYSGDLAASPLALDELLHCFLESTWCPALVATGAVSPLRPPRPTPPAAPYVGVGEWPAPHAQRLRLLALLLAGARLNLTEAACRREGAAWMPGWGGAGGCHAAALNFSVALSPAFELPDYDLSAGLYSSWTESVWSRLSLRLLVLPAVRRERLAVGLGCGSSLLALLLVLAGRRHVASLLRRAQASPETDSSNVDC